MPVAEMLLTLSAAVMLPPGQPVVDHSQPYHYAQPTVRVFEERRRDDRREANYREYVAQLAELWHAYRLAGSTPEAFEEYKAAAAEAKRQYIYADPWYVPIHNDVYYQR